MRLIVAAASTQSACVIEAQTVRVVTVTAILRRTPIVWSHGWSHGAGFFFSHGAGFFWSNFLSKSWLCSFLRTIEVNLRLDGAVAVFGGSLVQGYFVCEFFHALNKYNHLNYFVISKKVQKAKVTLYQKNARKTSIITTYSKHCINLNPQRRETKLRRLKEISLSCLKVT
jgi:hypothetical protein